MQFSVTAKLLAGGLMVLALAWTGCSDSSSSIFQYDPTAGTGISASTNDSVYSLNNYTWNDYALDTSIVGGQAVDDTTAGSDRIIDPQIKNENKPGDPSNPKNPGGLS